MTKRHFTIDGREILDITSMDRVAFRIYAQRARIYATSTSSADKYTRPAIADRMADIDIEINPGKLRPCIVKALKNKAGVSVLQGGGITFRRRNVNDKPIV